MPTIFEAVDYLGALASGVYRCGQIPHVFHALSVCQLAAHAGASERAQIAVVLRDALGLPNCNEAALRLRFGHDLVELAEQIDHPERLKFGVSYDLAVVILADTIVRMNETRYLSAWSRSNHGEQARLVWHFNNLRRPLDSIVSNCRLDSTQRDNLSGLNMLWTDYNRLLADLSNRSV